MCIYIYIYICVFLMFKTRCLKRGADKSSLFGILHNTFFHFLTTKNLWVWVAFSIARLLKARRTKKDIGLPCLIICG